MSEGRLVRLRPLTERQAARLLNRLDDSCAKGPTRDETRGALMSLLAREEEVRQLNAALSQAVCWFVEADRLAEMPEALRWVYEAAVKRATTLAANPHNCAEHVECPYCLRQTCHGECGGE